MTLPTRLHAIFSTLQATQNLDIKPSVQRAKNANAHPTHPNRRISINISSILEQYNSTQRQSPPTTRLTLIRLPVRFRFANKIGEFLTASTDIKSQPLVFKY